MYFFIAVLIIAIVTVLTMPKPQSQNTAAAGINQFQVPTAQEGKPIGVLFGTKDIDGSNCVWYGNLRSVAITKSGGSS